MLVTGSLLAVYRDEIATGSSIAEATARHMERHGRRNPSGNGPIGGLIEPLTNGVSRELPCGQSLRVAQVLPSVRCSRNREPPERVLPAWVMLPAWAFDSADHGGRESRKRMERLPFATRWMGRVLGPCTREERVGWAVFVLFAFGGQPRWITATGALYAAANSGL